ncbi:hypothetical protein PRIPAC_95368, partial [Pristionchus pacificus]
SDSSIHFTLFDSMESTTINVEEINSYIEKYPLDGGVGRRVELEVDMAVLQNRLINLHNSYMHIENDTAKKFPKLAIARRIIACAPSETTGKESLVRILGNKVTQKKAWAVVLDQTESEMAYCSGLYQFVNESIDDIQNRISETAFRLEWALRNERSEKKRKNGEANAQTIMKRKSGEANVPANKKKR